MKKKVVLLLVAALCCAPATWALEPIKFGLKFGIQGQSATMKEVFTDLPGLYSSGKLGYHFGAMARISLPVVYFQPELVYGINRFSIQEGSQSSLSYNTRNLDVPVLVGTKFSIVRVFAGPVFNLLTETKIKGAGAGNDFTTRFRRSTVGFQLGAGVEIAKKLNIDIRYGGQFKRPVQEITFNNVTQEIRTGVNAWQINVGYFF